MGTPNRFSSLCVTIVPSQTDCMITAQLFELRSRFRIFFLSSPHPFRQKSDQTRIRNSQSEIRIPPPEQRYLFARRCKVFRFDEIVPARATRSSSERLSMREPAALFSARSAAPVIGATRLECHPANLHAAIIISPALDVSVHTDKPGFSSFAEPRQS